MPDHMTIREIREQPTAIRRVLESLREREPVIADAVSGATTFCLVGCGTSYYLSLAGNALLNEVATSIAVPGGEVLMSPDQLPVSDVDCIVPVSRSGESTETVRATEALRERFPDATVLGITCTDGSTIHELADIPLISPFGAEESVVMTKSFSSMLTAFEYIAEVVEWGTVDFEKFSALPSASERTIDRAETVVKDLIGAHEHEKFVFLGSGENLGLASEAMLKLEEMTLSWTKAYHPLEFRHGPRSIADENTLVSVFLTERETEMHSELVDDIAELGATTLVVGPERVSDRIDGDYQVRLPERDGANLSLFPPVFHLLGYYRAVDSGLDPDDPPNLSQVVSL